jgi:hypothetical protein
MIYSESPNHRRASIVAYPDRNSLLILRAANGRVLRELIYPSDVPESWDTAYRALRREAEVLGYELLNSTTAEADQTTRSDGPRFRSH